MSGGGWGPCTAPSPRFEHVRRGLDIPVPRGRTVRHDWNSFNRDRLRSIILMILMAYSHWLSLRDRDWYCAKTIHTGCVWGQEWTPETHRNIIKTHHLKEFQDLKNGYITHSSLSLFRLVLVQVQYKMFVKPCNPFFLVQSQFLFRLRRQTMLIHHNRSKVCSHFTHESDIKKNADRIDK